AGALQSKQKQHLIAHVAGRQKKQQPEIGSAPKLLSGAYSPPECRRDEDAGEPDAQRAQQQRRKLAQRHFADNEVGGPQQHHQPDQRVEAELPVQPIESLPTATSRWVTSRRKS